jgi:hypothetical protein
MGDAARERFDGALGQKAADWQEFRASLRAIGASKGHRAGSGAVSSRASGRRARGSRSSSGGFWTSCSVAYSSLSVLTRQPSEGVVELQEALPLVVG